jgi:hypothetical protein
MPGTTQTGLDAPKAAKHKPCAHCSAPLKTMQLGKTDANTIKNRFSYNKTGYDQDKKLIQLQ